MIRRLLSPLFPALAAAAVVSAPTAASAFCGFYVGGADAKLFNKATQVVMMREGNRTVLSMQNDYSGPAKGFAMVVPVPTILKKEEVKTLDRKLFARVETLSAPRLVEYWEQNPCPKPSSGIGLGSIGTVGFGRGAGGTGFGSAKANRPVVKVEAKFSVDEYDIVILSAQDSTGLDQWLRDNKYNIPAGADAVLKPYVTQGMKFFVAKVNPAKVKKVNGRTVLAPLRFYYESDRFTLPTRLGLLNSAGTQDLIVNILAKGTRYEAANYDNVTIPTNIDVGNVTKQQFGSFYTSLFDDTVKKHPGAVVTEYAWDSGTCDPCSTTPLNPTEIATLGGDVVSGGSAQAAGPRRAVIRSSSFSVNGGHQPSVAARIMRRGQSGMRLCYDRALRTNPSLSGTVRVRLTVGTDGRVTKAFAVSTAKNSQMDACMNARLRALRFPSANAASVVTSMYQLTSRPGAAFGRSRMNGFVLTRLHFRYAKSSLGDDLVFRKAPPIVGGREFNVGTKLEQVAQKGSRNNFQGRYAIRHKWRGPILCKNPQRGIWGGPPRGAKPKTRAALSLAYAKRNARLASFVNPSTPLNVLVSEASDIPPPKPPATTAPPAATTTQPPAPVAPPAPIATSPASAPAAPAPAPVPNSQACGCRAPGNGGRVPTLLWLVGAAGVAAGVRRRVRRSK